MNIQARAGDWGFDMVLTLTNDDGTAYDLTGVTSAIFKMVDVERFRNYIDKAASIDGAPTAGKIRYTFQEGDLATEGNFRGAMELRYASGVRTTKAFYINVLKDLGP